MTTGKAVTVLCLLCILAAVLSWSLASCQHDAARVADSRVAIERASQENRTERLQSFLAALVALTVVDKQASVAPLIVGVLCGAAMMAAAERIKRT